MALLAALWPVSCCTSLTSSVSSSGPLGGLVGGANGKAGEVPKVCPEEEAGRLCQGSRWVCPGAFAALSGASAVCRSPTASPRHHSSQFSPRAPFPTVLPGGCPACDTRALQKALLCLERLYAALPTPKGTSFNVSRTLLEDAADAGALAIALKVTYPKGWDLVLPVE